MTEKKLEFIPISLKNKKYSCLANNYCSDLIIDGISYKSATAYFCSQHFYNINERAFNHIRNLESHMLIKKATNSYYLPQERILELENGLKDTYMRRAMYCKFMTNTEFSNKLTETGDNILIYKSSNSYWGSGNDGNGKNKIGEILMEIREVLKKF